jgi:hypothetical protein
VVKSLAEPGVGGFYTWRPNSFSTTIQPPLALGPSWIIGTGESTSTIRWKWASVTPVSWYELYSGGTFIASVDATSTVEVVAASPNVAYPRKVRAVTGGGSDHTAFTTYEYTAYTMANPPGLPSLTSGWNATKLYYITAVWTNGGNPGGTKYQLKRSNGTPVFGATTATTTTDVNITPPNKICTYEVVALNGNLKPSGSLGLVSATTPPDKPALSVTGYTTSEITWSWGAVAGANKYNFYINGIWIPTTEVSITRTSLPCAENAATVEAVSTANGTGEPGVLNKWTLPVTPPAPTGGDCTHGYGKAADLYWTSDINSKAIYIVECSLLTNEGYITPEANVATTQKEHLITPWGGVLVCFRIKARNGNTPPDYSGYSPYASFTTSGDIGGGGGTAPIVSQVKFNGRAYRLGAVVSSRPTITCIVTSDVEVDTSYTANAVWVDEGMPPPAVPFAFASDDVTYEAVPGAPANTWKITVRAGQSIPALPQSQHYIRIHVRSLTGGGSSYWEGTVGVGSGGVQMIGSAYNYPNPFRPLSTDPNQNTTRISYNLNVDATVTLVIYDITGHEVYRKTYRGGTDGGQAGLNSVPFNGSSMFGEALGNGMYLYKLISGGSVIGSGKLVVLD